MTYLLGGLGAASLFIGATRPAPTMVAGGLALVVAGLARHWRPQPTATQPHDELAERRERRERERREQPA